MDISIQEHGVERVLLRCAIKHRVSLSAIDYQDFRDLKDDIIQRSQKNSTDSKDCDFKTIFRKHYSKSAKQFGIKICNFIHNYLKMSFATIATNNSAKGHNQLTVITIKNPSIPEFNFQFLDFAVYISLGFDFAHFRTYYVDNLTSFLIEVAAFIVDSSTAELSGLNFDDENPKSNTFNKFIETSHVGYPPLVKYLDHLKNNAFKIDQNQLVDVQIIKSKDGCI
ncbi:MAG: hypothetical protein EZS28_008487 [Streblomastix strix]|uniref:Uncharacterized protein n=1 Tax=Streblomastix strix TaxID=222440 RepID=A0A5J4WMH5_9EUKA|nr:MAG: hypothetical protein EZS28_008487 [Streblomastix strix]